MLGLTAHRFLPDQAKPGQILENSCHKFSSAAAGVDVLNAEQKPSVGGTGGVMGKERGEGMAQVQPPGGAWRKARHNLAHRDVNHKEFLLS
jgi:hypothetical protein